MVLSTTGLPEHPVQSSWWGFCFVLLFCSFSLMHISHVAQKLRNMLSAKGYPESIRANTYTVTSFQRPLNIWPNWVTACISASLKYQRSWGTGEMARRSTAPTVLAEDQCPVSSTLTGQLTTIIRSVPGEQMISSGLLRRLNLCAHLHAHEYRRVIKNKMNVTTLWLWL